MSGTTFEVVANYTTAEGRQNDVLARLKELAKASREEPGNLRYEYFQGIENPLRIVILESYRTAADYQAHRDSEHFQNIGAENILPLLQHRSISTYEAPTT